MGDITNNCIKCGADLTNNIYDCCLKKHHYICKYCYIHRPNKKQHDHDYYLRNKDSIAQKYGDAKTGIKERVRTYRQANKDIISAKRKAVLKNSPDARIKKSRLHAKDRGLGFIMLSPNPFADNVKVDWHHITDCHVVAIPKELHRPHIRFKYHREFLMNTVKQIYLQEEGVIQTE